ncbi:MAG: flagellar protein FlaG [Nitrospirota bacterium]
MEIKGIDIGLPLTSQIFNKKPENVKRAVDAGSPVEQKAEPVFVQSEAVKAPEAESYKAFFAIDDNKNVVIRIVDSEGNLVRQIPPEEFINMVEKMKEISEDLYSKRV